MKRETEIAIVPSGLCHHFHHAYRHAATLHLSVYTRYSAPPSLLKSMNHKSFWLSTSDEGEVIVHSIVPTGLIVSNGAYGRNLIAAQHFSAGTLLYRGYAALLDTSVHHHKFHLHLYTNDSISKYQRPKQQFLLDALNSVKDHCEPNQDIRQVYGFDGFMNHSCDANVYCPLVYRNQDEMCYDTIALLDIQPGDELSCDYACFDYECDGHEIEQCGCNSPNCRGEMKGFKELSLDEKLRIMPRCEAEIIEKFFTENPQHVLLECTIPNNQVCIDSDHVDSMNPVLIAARSFAPGDLIVSQPIKRIPWTMTMQRIYICKFVEESETYYENKASRVRYIRLDENLHFMKNASGSLFLGLAAFIDRSGNTGPVAHVMFQDNEALCAVYANQSISVNELISC